MRNWTKAIAVFAGLGAVPLAHSADISQGLWQITMESRVAESPGFTPAPYQLTKCFTAQDARDPSRILGEVANPGATGCTYTERNYAGNTFSFAMQCAGSFGIVSTGKVSFTSDTMEGNIAAKASVAGKDVEMQNRISARRVGGC